MIARVGLMAIVAIALAGDTLHGDQQWLRLRVSPKTIAAPGSRGSSGMLEPHEANRVLEITAISEDFSRASTIQLDGISAPRLAVIDYPNLPAGVYEVSAVLRGPNGTRATAADRVRVV